MNNRQARIRFRLWFLLLLVPVCAGVAYSLRPPPPPADHWLTDVAGGPLSKARLSFSLLDENWEEVPDSTYAMARCDKEGGFALPVPQPPSGVVVRVSHRDLGGALIRLGEHDINRTKRLRLPLVPAGTEYANRAVRGRVVDHAGKPVADAEVHCAEVRTPGEGLVNPLHPNHSALTDRDGGFVLYLPNGPLGGDYVYGANPPHVAQGDQRGEYVPINSDYYLEVSPPHGSESFPVSAVANNIELATIRLPHATERQDFEFESLDGGLLSDPDNYRWITLTHLPPPDGRRVKLPNRVVREGGLLLPGEYHAEYRDQRGNTIRWEPLIVQPGAPTTLRFVIPAATTFVGRLVDGTTGEPLPRAFIGGFSATSGKNFAMVTAEEWETLEQAPLQPAVSSDAVKPLMEQYRFEAVARSDKEGRFELVEPKGIEFHSLVAFGRDRLRHHLEVYKLREQQGSGPLIDTGDIPLFPAARLYVRPVFEPKPYGRASISVSPHWVLEEEGQPDWFPKLKAVQSEYGSGGVSSVHWMQLNERRPILAPAGVRFRMEFRIAYNDEWYAINRPEVFQIAAGESADFGKLAFARSLPIELRVVGPDGRPVEGAPVSRLVEVGARRVWSVTHNSDADGLVTFYARPGADATFAVHDYDQTRGVITSDKLQIKPDEVDPEDLPEIKLTKELVEAVTGTRE